MKAKTLGHTNFIVETEALVEAFAKLQAQMEIETFSGHTGWCGG